MWKRLILYMLLLLTLFLVSCNNEREELLIENSQLKQENQYLNSEIVILSDEIGKNNRIISEHESNIKILESDLVTKSENLEKIKTSKSLSNDYYEYDELRKKDAFDYLKRELIRTNNEEKDMEYRNLFEPDYVNIGDIIGNNKVVDTYLTDSLKIIKFDGVYHVTATYTFAAIGNILQIIDYKSEIPYTMYDIDQDNFSCKVSNEQEFIEELGEYFKHELDYKVKIKAVFKNLQYNIQYHTDRYSTVEFVELIEIIEE